MILSAKVNNADKQYFKIEGLNVHLILKKKYQINIMIRKAHKEELKKLHSSTVIIANKIGGGEGAVVCHRKDKFTEKFRP